MPLTVPDGLDLNQTYGAMMIGVLIATFFQGILTVQSFFYYEKFWADPIRNRIMVAVLWLLDLAHLIMISQALYHYLIDHFGDVDNLRYSTLPFDLHVTFVAIPSAICHLFFLHRIWIFSGKNIWWTGFLAIFAVATFILYILVTVNIYNARLVELFGTFRSEIIAKFAIGAIADLLMAGSLCWYLKQGKSHFKQTNNIITQIIQVTVATGLSTSMVAVACLIAYLIHSDNLVFIAIHFSLGRMYTNSLLATLNARSSLRTNGLTKGYQSTGEEWSVQNGPRSIGGGDGQTYALGSTSHKGRQPSAPMAFDSLDQNYDTKVIGLAPEHNTPV